MPNIITTNLRITDFDLARFRQHATASGVSFNEYAKNALQHYTTQVILGLTQKSTKKKLDLKDLAQLTKRQSKGEPLSPEDKLIYG